MSYPDSEKQREYNQRYRETHREQIRERQRKDSRKRRLENKEQLYELKSPCAKCGESRPYVIDFHHIDPSEKRFNISTRGTHYSVDTVREEVTKCVCLCRNCHIEFHYLYGNQPKNPIDDLTEYLGKNPYDVRIGGG